MEAIGIVRKVDELGRVVIPKETRDKLGIKIGNPVEFYVDGNKIVIQKYRASNECIICGNCKDIITFKGKNICLSCVDEFGPGKNE